MRQRNVKNKEEIINNSKYIVDNYLELKGQWQKVFDNDNPIYIEIGMGKGKFILENALRYPNINFIGIEKYDSIMALAIKKIQEYELNNLKLIRMNANNIDNVFNKEIDRIYLNFSDPWPKARTEKRRLTSSVFLNKYDNLFRDKMIIEMKTDNRNLFEYSLISFNNHNYKIKEINLDLHKTDNIDNIMTEYEEKFSKLNNIIYYVKVEK